MLAYFVPFFIGLIVSYALTPAVKKLAVRVGAVDRPEARKVHTHIIRLLCAWEFGTTLRIYRLR